MDNELRFAVFSLVVLLLALIAGVVIEGKYRQDAIVELVRLGADPITASCALGKE